MPSIVQRTQKTKTSACKKSLLICGCGICVQYCSPLHQKYVWTFIMVGGMFDVSKIRYRYCRVVEHHRFCGGSVMSWAGISVDCATELLIISNGTLTTARYGNEILHPIVRPFAGAVGPEFVLMDDNTRPYRARVVNVYLEQESIERIEWPAYSPDLNPIEYAWDIIQRRVNPCPNKLRSIQEISNAVTESGRRNSGVLSSRSQSIMRKLSELGRTYPSLCRYNWFHLQR